jgi:hypothetical protein
VIALFRVAVPPEGSRLLAFRDDTDIMEVSDPARREETGSEFTLIDPWWSC